ncbi:hypothetical protein GWK47_052557 [Chionoecetes opilio]|uniref:HAT C-terminal dimerisation domain-containing protein n=1 Tax=Chionoecetes opilio TaxID=41210 RepID=A0A8J5CSP1_CHIOP|nr:hypothetical protein GWK47_052557 [Chionoecetes opilio]
MELWCSCGRELKYLVRMAPNRWRESAEKHFRKRKYVRKLSILNMIPARLRAPSRERCLPTTIHPLFKLHVIRLLNPEKVDTMKSRLLFEITEQAVLDTSEGSSPDEDEEADFFKARLVNFIRIKCIFTQYTHLQRAIYNSTRISNKMGKELESWCSEKQRNKLLEQGMFPALSRATWVDVFVNYNTAIPSSAAVERLFSQGSGILKAKRASLISDNFERLVFMKGNMDLLKI